MPQNVAVFQTAKLLTLSVTGSAATAGAVSLSMQLNQPQAFFYLQLPLWFFYIAMVVLTFVGGFLSLTTDYMRSRGTLAGKMVTALSVGLVVSFVVLPTIITEPSVGVMLITALVGGFSGTTLVYVSARLLSSKELLDAVTDLIRDRAIKFLTVIADLIADHATKVITAVLAGMVASFVLLPGVSSETENSVALRPSYQEVTDD